MSEYVKGLVSIIIPTYKRSVLLKRAIDTALKQTYKNIEILVVNDNISGDEYSNELYTLIDSYTDSRLTLVEQDKHINGAAARNAGICIAKGEYIAFQDDDDYWELEKIERQVELLSSLDESYGAVSCLMRLYKNGKLTFSSLPYRSGYILIDILDRRTSMGTGALLIRRNALDQVGYFDENLKRHQDLQIFARLTAKYKIQLDSVYLHNREIIDNQNRPTPEMLEEIKSAYYESIRDILNSLSPRARKKIFIMHDFECAYTLVKSGKKKEGVRKALVVLKMPETIGLAIIGLYRRIIQKKMKYILDKKYSIHEELTEYDEKFDVELKQVLLDMMKWFHKLCEENNIRYYALGGTMLGAARHRGFIPWDDDIDVGIPRSDYERLMVIFKENPNLRYVIETPLSDAKDFFYTHAKIYDTKTTLIERAKTNIKRGIFIDVFPLDGLGDNIIESKKRFSIINWCSILLISRITAVRKGRKLLKNLAVLTLQLIPSFILDNKKLQRKIDKLCRKYDFDKCIYGGNLLGHWGFKEVMETRIMGTPTLYDFEDMQIYGAENYKEYLEHLYGEWEKLPPENKQVSIHDFIICDLKKSYLD